MESQPFERLYTAEEAGELLRETGQTLRLWANKGIIAAYRPGRKYLFRESEIRRMLDSNEVGRGE